MDFISSITNNFVQFNNNGQRNRNVTYSSNYNQPQAQEDVNSNNSEYEYEEIEDEEGNVDDLEARRRMLLEKRKIRIEELNLFQYKNIDKFLTRKDE
jgi:hypothetical protein